MPIPTPSKGEKKDAFIPRCIGKLRNLDPKRDPAQIAAICYAQWDKAHPKKKHKKPNHKECMECKKPPEVDVLWANGKGRAWFCKEHFEEWKKKPNSMSDTKTNEGDICKVYKVKGEVPKRWTDHKGHISMQESPFYPDDEYAIVQTTGEELGREVDLSEVMKGFTKPIVLKRPYISLTGGIVNWGMTTGNINIYVSDPMRYKRIHPPIEFRMGRALPAELNQRLVFHFGEYGGMYTSHVPLYDLVLVPSTLHGMVRMEESSALQPSLDDQVHILRLGTQTSDLHEVFISGPDFNGRWLIQIQQEEECTNTERTFMLQKPKDQTPYVLSQQAIESEWVPPQGASYLPPGIRTHIPERFKYWEKKNSIERKRLRNELVDAINSGEVKLSQDLEQEGE